MAEHETDSAGTSSQRIVRRNFTFPEDFLEKFERLKKKLGATSNSEVLRIALNKLDEAGMSPAPDAARAQERDTANEERKIAV